MSLLLLQDGTSHLLLQDGTSRVLLQDGSGAAALLDPYAANMATYREQAFAPAHLEQGYTLTFRDTAFTPTDKIGS